MRWRPPTATAFLSSHHTHTETAEPHSLPTRPPGLALRERRSRRPGSLACEHSSQRVGLHRLAGIRSGSWGYGIWPVEAPNRNHELAYIYGGYCYNNGFEEVKKRGRGMNGFPQIRRNLRDFLISPSTPNSTTTLLTAIPTESGICSVLSVNGLSVDASSIYIPGKPRRARQRRGLMAWWLLSR